MRKGYIMKFNFKTLRQQANLTQTKAAQLLNVTQATISNWESGKSLPSIKTLFAVAKLYKCSVDELLKGVEPLNV